MKTKNTTIAARLREAMARAGMSKSALAREAPIDRAHLTRILNGQVGLGPAKAKALAAVLGVSPSWLLGLEDGAAPEGQQGREQVDELPPTERLAREFGYWMLELPADIRAIVFRIGNALVEAQRKSGPWDTPECRDLDTVSRARRRNRRKAAAKG